MPRGKRRCRMPASRRASQPHQPTHPSKWTASQPAKTFRLFAEAWNVSLEPFRRGARGLPKGDRRGRPTRPRVGDNAASRLPPPTHRAFEPMSKSELQNRSSNPQKRSFAIGPTRPTLPCQVRQIAPTPSRVGAICTMRHGGDESWGRPEMSGGYDARNRVMGGQEGHEKTQHCLTNTS